MDPAALRRARYRLGRQAATDLLLLSHAERGAGDHARARLVEQTAVLESWQPPALPVDGHDLGAAGMSAGRAVGRALAELEDWWIAQDFRPGRAELLARARAMAAGERCEGR